MLSLTDIYLCSLISLFFMIPILAIVFCIKRRDLRFKRILFSFSLLVAVLGIGIIGNYDYILQALENSPMTGFMVFVFIILTIFSLLTGYEEVLAIPSKKNSLIWTQQLFTEAVKNYKPVPNKFPSSRKRILDIIEYSPIGVIILDKKLNLIGVNAALTYFLGYKKKEVKFLSLMDIFGSDRNAEYEIREVLKEYRKHKLEFIRKLKQKDGSIKYGKLIVYYIKDESRENDYHLVIQILDMTREVELQRKTRRFNALLQEKVNKQTQILNKKDKNLEYLTHAMSHDLKAPIKNLDGLFELYVELSKIADVEDREKCEQHIKRNIKRMDKIIADLFLFFNSQKDKIRKEVYNPSKHIQEIIDTYAKGLYANLTIEAKVDKLPMIYADKGILFHVWQNLIVNAIKYASKNDVVKLHVSGYNKYGQTILSIKDNGIGFLEEEADLLFKPFKRLSNTKAFSGTGLGLPIVKEMIERHGGTIWAESTEGEGSIFHISLPKKEMETLYGKNDYGELINGKGVNEDVVSLLEEINNKEKLIFGKPVKR